MKPIDPAWILEFFEEHDAAMDLWVQEGASIKDVYVDGSFSPQEMANFLNRKTAEQIRQPGEDWTPTAENINALPEGMKKYVYGLETLCDPQYIIRENILMKDLISQLEAKIEQEEK